MGLVDFFGYLATATSVISFFPQIYKTQCTRSAGDLSMLMLINFLICSAAWLAYGLLEGVFHVALCNVICTLASLVMIIQKVIFDRESARDRGA